MKSFRLWERNNGYVYVMFYDRPGKWISSGQTTKGAATDWAIENLNAKEKKVITFRQFAKDFFQPGKCRWLNRRLKKGRAPSAATLKAWKRIVKNYLLPVWGDYVICSISGRELDDWLIELKDFQNGNILSGQTKNHIRYVISIVFQEAKDEGYIDQNPIESISRFENNWKKRDQLTLEEIHKLFPEDRNKLLKIWHNQLYVVFFMLLFDSGFRPGETLALRWADWYRSYNGIVAVQALDDTGEVGNIKGSRPGKKVKKPARLSSRTEQELLLWESKSKNTEKDDYIFCQVKGKPVTRRTIARRFDMALEKAEVDPAGRNLSPYSLRHEFNTDMLKTLPMATVQTLMGHSTDKMTRHYADLTEIDLLEKVKDAGALVEQRWKPFT